MGLKGGGDGWGGDSWEGGKGGGKGKSKGPKVELKYPAGQKVWVGGMSPETTQESLQEYFALGGTVVAAALMKPGTGCVVYSSEEEAQQAIAVLNGTELGGQVLQV